MDDSNTPPARAQVWLVAGAEDLTAMHDGIAIYSGNGCRFLHCANNPEPGRPAAAAFAIAGFLGTLTSDTHVLSVDTEEPGLVRLRGFWVDQDKLAEVEIAARQALAGNLGGFFPAMMAQVGFHRSVVAFEYTWAAAGKPPIMIAQPGFPKASRGVSRPGSILAAAAKDSRIRAVLESIGELESLESGQE